MKCSKYTKKGELKGLPLTFLFKKGEGFTLIEIMVALAIFVMVVIVGNSFISQGFRYITFTSEQDTALENARRVMDPIIKDIRAANTSEHGDYALAEINPQNFIYYTDTDKDEETEKIRYFLDGSFLKQEIIEPGDLKDYSGDPVLSTLVEYVNNGEDPIFRYYNSDNNETDVINDVRLVKVRLNINVYPEKAPEDHWAESDVQLRNLKDNL